jgi:hypothetical protein
MRERRCCDLRIATVHLLLDCESDDEAADYLSETFRDMPGMVDWAHAYVGYNWTEDGYMPVADSDHAFRDVYTDEYMPMGIPYTEGEFLNFLAEDERVLTLAKHMREDQRRRGPSRIRRAGLSIPTTLVRAATARAEVQFSRRNVAWEPVWNTPEPVPWSVDETGTTEPADDEPDEYDPDELTF